MKGSKNQFKKRYRDGTTVIAMQDIALHTPADFRAPNSVNPPDRTDDLDPRPQFVAETRPHPQELQTTVRFQNNRKIAEDKLPAPLKPDLYHTPKSVGPRRKMVGR